MPSWYGFKTQDPLFDPNLGQPSRGGRGNIGVPPQPTPRQMQQQAYQTGAAPRGGGRGWQAGGDVAAPTPPGGYTPAGPAPSMPQDPMMMGERDPQMFQAYISAKLEAIRKAQAAAQRAQAATARRGTQAQRQASRGPGGWQGGGAVDSAEALMAERESLQQLLQMETDNERAMILLSRIDEITKELEMAAAGGMANGGIASLMGI